MMDRDTMLGRVEEDSTLWDLIIIGGGATGLGTAIESASRGYQTLLLEQGDFARGTSSRSTKLVHGGVRYLKQGNLSLVLEALRERGLMRQNAPHLVHNLPFVVPNYDWWEAPFYGIGLRLYDMLAGRHGFGASQNLSREETLSRIPTIETKGLRGGVVYYDGQFDDARLAINMAQTAAELGATAVNYMSVTGLSKSGGIVRGVLARDLESGRDYELSARGVVNATGAYVDAVRRMDAPNIEPLITPSQGVHIVLGRDFLPGASAVMVPHTDDGRVLFAVPWHDRVVVGTTDTPLDDIPLEPRPLADEVEFLLTHAARYLNKDPAPSDVLSTFAGIRPLVGGGADDTARMSRDHMIFISRSGLVTITGGKWTTYRKMAEDTVEQAATLVGLEERPSVTRKLPIHGFHRSAETLGELSVYGSDAPLLEELIREKSSYADRLHPRLPARLGEVVWAVRREMARTVEDVLARRTRCLLLDAKASIEAAPLVARLMAKELGKDDVWQDQQTRAYQDLAEGYMI